MQLLLRSACANLVLICLYQWTLSFSEPTALFVLALAFIFHSSVFVVAACRIRLTRRDDTLRWTFITWSLVFLWLTTLIGLRHVVGVDPEIIALASATWLLLVLTVSASCTCHVILHASKEWSDHLFVACTAFWWMFHDPANPWVARSGYWPVAPSLLLFIVRLTDSVDAKRFSPVEIGSWLGLLILDTVWVLNRISHPWFFALYGVGIILNVVLATSCASTGRLFCVPCAIPFFIGYTCALSCVEKPSTALHKAYTRADEMMADLDPDMHSLVHDLGIPEV